MFDRIGKESHMVYPKQIGNGQNKLRDEWSKKAHFERGKVVSQLFVRRDNSLSLKLVTAKFTTDLLLAGDVNELKTFPRRFQKGFK